MGNNSRFFFVLLAVSAAIGIGGVWLYSYHSFMLTGLFFIPYLIALIVLGLPLLMLEFSLGQLFKKNIVDLFASIRKWLSPIGWLMVFNAFIAMSFYAVVLSWHVIYFFVSFGMQWKNNAESYFLNNVVQVADGFKGFTHFSLPVFIASIIAWLIIFFHIRKGFESMKKGLLIAFPLLAALMILFMSYSLTLDNALAGIYYFLKPRLKGLLDLNVWVNAFSLAVLSLGLAFGVMHTIARRGRGFIMGSSIIVVAFELLTGIAAGFILFGVLGFLSMRQSIGLEALASSDFYLSFTTLTQALPFFHKPTLLSLLFFIFLSIFLIFGAAFLAYTITHVLVHKFRTKHINAAIFVSGFGFLFGLIFIIKPGFHIMDIVNHFIYYNILIALLLETIAVGWFFESEKLAAYINQQSMLKIGAAWKLIVRYLIPIILLFLLFTQIKSDFLLDYHGYPWLYVLIFGVGIVVVPLVAAYLMPQRIFDRK